MKEEHVFNDFNEFANFLQDNSQLLNNSALKNFIDVLAKARETNCGMCKRKNIKIAEETYRNLFTIITQEEKVLIKQLLNTNSVKFFYDKAPMFNF